MGIRGFFGRLFGRGQVSTDTTDQFLFQQKWMPVSSSNVAEAQFREDKAELWLTFHDGSSYVYFDVTRSEAYDFWQAGSKGKWVWDHLRLRGTKTGHQKAFSGPY